MTDSSPDSLDLFHVYNADPHDYDVIAGIFVYAHDASDALQLAWRHVEESDDYNDRWDRRIQKPSDLTVEKIERKRGVMDVIFRPG